MRLEFLILGTNDQGDKTKKGTMEKSNVPSNFKSVLILERAGLSKNSQTSCNRSHFDEHVDG